MLKYKIHTTPEGDRVFLTWKPDHEIKWSGKEIRTREDETDEEGLVLVGGSHHRTGQIWGGNDPRPVGNLEGGVVTRGYWAHKESGTFSKDWAVQHLEQIARELVILLEKIEADAASTAAESEWKTL